MNVTHKDHISIFDDVLEKEICDKMIELYDLYDSVHGSTKSSDYTISDSSLSRNDSSIFCTKDLFPQIRNCINDVVDQCFEEYRKEFFQADSVSIDFDEVKLQKTPIRGGFHNWHAEVHNMATIERCIVWMIYLNDIPENEGETEFLWQKVRVQPKAGRVVIWPAFFTHCHRGNPVYTHPKYIATGWGLYADEYMDDIYFQDRRGFYHKVR
jgi:hypothetical protein